MTSPPDWMLHLIPELTDEELILLKAEVEKEIARRVKEVTLQ